MFRIIFIFALVSIAHAQSGWQKYITDITSKAALSDTVSTLATKSNITAYIDSSKALFWADTALTNGISTEFDLQTTLYSKTRRHVSIYKNAGATTVTAIGIPAPTVGSTAASNDLATGPFLQHTTPTTANYTTGIITAAAVTRRDWDPEYYTVFRTGGDLTLINICIGLFSALVDSSRNPNLQVASFRYHTGADGTAFWRTVTNQGSGNQSVTTTSVAIAVNTTYKMRIVCSSATPDIKFYIDDVLVATHTGASLPTATTALLMGNLLTVTTATAKAMNWGRIELLYNN